MALVNNPPYFTGPEDVFRDVDLETWSVAMTNSNNEFETRVRMVEDTYISLSRLQAVVAASTDFDDFKTRIAALT